MDAASVASSIALLPSKVSFRTTSSPSACAIARAGASHAPATRAPTRSLDHANFTRFAYPAES
jgi:hypothetical protein